MVVFRDLHKYKHLMKRILVSFTDIKLSVGRYCYQTFQSVLTRRVCNCCMLL